MVLSRVGWLRLALAAGLVALGAAGVQGQQNKKKAAPAHHAPAHRARPAAHRMKNGNSVQRGRNGHVRNVHDERRHMDVHHGLNGDRRVSVERADHSRLVAERGRRGYIEHSYGYHGHEYYRRAYYWHGHAYNRFYRGFYFHGVGLHVYVPYHYWRPAFYGWAYHPWRTRIVYEWGWGPRPWFGYYHYYFAPYPVYTRPSAWLTDYVISQDLEASYEAGRAAGIAEMTTAPMPPAGAPLLTPEVKDEIANEIEYELKVENGEAAMDAGDEEADPASSGLARIFADGQTHVFVVGGALDVDLETDDAAGPPKPGADEECALSDGDVLQLTVPPGPNDKTASLSVLASKGGHECAKGAMVAVPLDELQEMQNHLRETLDHGMEELQQKQGKDGLPAAPAAAMSAPTPAKFAELAPPPDPAGEQEIAQQQKVAEDAEKEVTAQEAAEPDASAAPTIKPAPVPTQAPAPIVRKQP